MHFRFKQDKNANFTYQNGEWVFISAFFLLSSHLTPNNLSPFICYYITLSGYVFHFLNDSKNKTVFWSSLVPKDTLSRILTVKLLMTCQLINLNQPKIWRQLNPQYGNTTKNISCAINLKKVWTSILAIEQSSKILLNSFINTWC